MSVTSLPSLHAGGRHSLFSPFAFSLARRLSHFSRRKRFSFQSLFLAHRKIFIMPPKRKRSSVAAATAPENGPMLHRTPIPPPKSSTKPPAPKRQASRRGRIDTNPDHNADIIDGKTALRASPDADENGESLEVEKVNGAPNTPAKTNGRNGTLKNEDTDSPLSDIELPVLAPSKKQKKTPTKS